MIKIEKISMIQLGAIILVNRFLFGFAFMPTVTIAPANQDAWLAEILSAVLMYITLLPLIIMATRFRNKTFAEYTMLIMGKPLGILIGLYYSIYLTGISLLTVLYLADFLMSVVYPQTPIYFIVIFMTIPCMYAAYKGLECIGRASILFSIFIISVVILYFILNFNNMDFKYFLPILSDSDMSNFSFGIFNNATRFCDAFLLFNFIPFVSENKKYPVAKIVALLIATYTSMNLIATIGTQGVLTPILAKSFRYPYYTSIQQINMFDIIQRIDFFNIINWIIIFFVKIASSVFAISIILSRIFQTKSNKPFIIPVNIIIFVLAVFTSLSYFANFRIIIYDIAYKVIFTSNAIIPSIILIVYLFRKKELSKIAPNEKHNE
jgi:spore germination protein (amino acid permease)